MRPMTLTPLRLVLAIPLMPKIMPIPIPLTHREPLSVAQQPLTLHLCQVFLPLAARSTGLVVLTPVLPLETQSRNHRLPLADQMLVTIPLKLPILLLPLSVAQQPLTLHLCQVFLPLAARSTGLVALIPVLPAKLLHHLLV